jgi:hypothetical protein
VHAVLCWLLSVGHSTLCIRRETTLCGFCVGLADNTADYPCLRSKYLLLLLVVYIFSVAGRALPRSSDLRVFHAGYILMKTRQETKASIKNKAEVRCSQNHVVNQNHCIYCSDCRCHCCYKHMLAAGIHSIEAIISQDKGPAEWHHKHLTARAVPLKRSSKGAKEAEASNNYAHRRVLLALNYPFCSSLNPGHTRPGWYDVPCSPKKLCSGTEVSCCCLR